MEDLGEWLGYPMQAPAGELRKCPLQLELSILLATCPDADIELPTLSHPGVIVESKFQVFPLSCSDHPEDRAFLSGYSADPRPPEAAVTTSRARSLLRRV